ncbi:MAG: hypothetical protein HQL49_06085 [Gammaproteobacteria bacterium]|nr:hypothetical protein [Gammaproteobacteria bacterium]
MDKLMVTLVLLLWLHEGFAEGATPTTGLLPVTISRSEWQLPRSGELLLQKEELRQLMQQLAQVGGVLLMRYPGGDEGVFWAGQLESWLIALGLSRQRMRLLAGVQGNSGMNSDEFITLERIKE